MPDRVFGFGILIQITLDLHAVEVLLTHTVRPPQPRVVDLHRLGDTDAAIAKKIVLLLEKLDEHDDVQNVYSNFEASDEIMATLDV